MSKHSILENLLGPSSRHEGILHLELATLIKGGLGVYVAWLIGLCVYRLYFSPLAGFPGSKLAAATGWVETYHEVYRGGQFVFKIQEWHEKYGPIVRIGPSEVHISDPDCVDAILAGGPGAQYDKKKEWKRRFGDEHSGFSTIEHHHHRLRRSALAPFFSKQKIAGVERYVADKAHRLCDRLQADYGGGVAPALLNKCFASMTFDIVTYYAFARSFDYLEHPTFDADLTSSVKSLVRSCHVMGQFPWMLSFLECLPRRVAGALNPSLGTFNVFIDQVNNQIEAIKSGDNQAYKEVAHKTIFKELFDANLPPEEKTVERLRHEGVSIVGAGVETTSNVLSKAVFWILNDPSIHQRLTAELDSVWPDSSSDQQTPPLSTLEALPYLGAVLDEALRLSYPVTGRSVRTSPRSPVTLHVGGGLNPKGETTTVQLPAGTYFSTSMYLTHQDQTVWGEDALEFRPERWLGGDGKALREYLVAFSRGPRMCLGMNLARAELFIGLAVVVRRLRMELFETTEEAVVVGADYFVPFPPAGAEWVKVLVK
ncbi:hypothetical protein MCOR25_009508 [Pyricularia grisea]|nr:hypothetical protein MCOR25_009508 [Pyricularia grisea]